VPIIYLVDSAGVNLPYQGGRLPGQYGASRIFYYNSIMRRYLRIPQIAAVMGQCIAGGAYLPALSDVILMVEGTSFMGLGGPNLVKGATGQSTDSETLGARTRTTRSPAWRTTAPRRPLLLARIRELVAELPRPVRAFERSAEPRPPGRPEADLYRILPADHRQPYEVRELLAASSTAGNLDEFQADYAPGDDLRHGPDRGASRSG
jgi:3-methylcrotonyl-CoA carboxylase beta subunit